MYERIGEAEYGLTAQALAPGGGYGQPNPDDRLRVNFSMIPVEDVEASQKEGRPIYVDKEHITIMIPGERDVVIRQSWKKDHDRFPRQYAAFKNRQNQDTVSGTPLKLMTWIAQSQIKELEFFNCVTVEQLAELSDNRAQQFMQIQKLKQLAKDYLRAAKEAAPLTAMRAEMDKKDSQIEALSGQVQSMAKQLEELLKAKK